MNDKKAERLYLYLARRDKTDVRVIAVLNGAPRTGRVTNVNDLSLSTEVLALVNQAIYDNRMYWEPWIDTANSYRDLRDKLFSRGFKNLPLSSSPIIPVMNGSNYADTSSMPKKEIMMRRVRD